MKRVMCSIQREAGAAPGRLEEVEEAATPLMKGPLIFIATCCRCDQPCQGYAYSENTPEVGGSFKQRLPLECQTLFLAEVQADAFLHKQCELIWTLIEIPSSHLLPNLTLLSMSSFVYMVIWNCKENA